MKTTDKTAAQAYDDMRIEVAAQLARIEAALVAHRAEQKMSPHLWTHLGDLTEVRTRLADIAKFLG